MWFCDAPESSFDYSFAVNRSSRLVSRDVSLKFDTAGPKPDRLACRPSWTGAFLFATSERREWLWRGDVREDSAMDRKKRRRNFSNRDRFLLTDVMKTEVKVIESKRHDGRSNDARKQAWKNVVNAFNARTDEKREEKQLAQLWRDMKRNAKKDHSRFRRQRMGTGGGPEPAPLESLTSGALSGRGCNRRQQCDMNADTWCPTPWYDMLFPFNYYSKPVMDGRTMLISCEHKCTPIAYMPGGHLRL